MMHGDMTGEAASEAQPGPGLRACLEAILLVVDEPVPEVVLAQVLERPREEIAPETGAILYRTTGYFLERLGLAGLEALPDLAPFLPDQIEDAEGAEPDFPGSVGTQDPEDPGRGQVPGGTQDSADPGRAQDPGGAQ